ncbi:hypothetical protein NL676_006285 [Syzygium grande]|nr:hypothetical protein NL676_006285 [Syzygium grande]
MHREHTVHVSGIVNKMSFDCILWTFVLRNRAGPNPFEPDYLPDPPGQRPNSESNPDAPGGYPTRPLGEDILRFASSSSPVLSTPAENQIAARLRRAPPAPPMSPYLLSSRSLHPITSRHLSPAAAAPPSPPLLAPASLRPSPPSAAAAPPSLTCVLQCPHFESFGVLSGTLCTYFIPRAKLLTGIEELGIEPHDEDQGTGDLRYVQMATSTSNVIFGNRWRHLLGDRDFWEHLGGIDVSLAPSSFGQANTRAFDSLLQKLQKYVPYGASVTDLYAGSGVIGLSLAATRKCRSVKCVEYNKESKLSFEKIVEPLPKYVDSSISWYQADTSVETTSWLVGSDVIVVDPPRKGLEASLVDALQTLPSLELKTRSSPESSKTKEERRPWVLRTREASVRFGNDLSEENRHSAPQTLIYISCAWESLKEDCKSLLSSKAWHLEKTRGFNFFPGTQSVQKKGKYAHQEKESGKEKEGITCEGAKGIDALTYTGPHPICSTEEDGKNFVRGLLHSSRPKAYRIELMNYWRVV